MANVTTNQQAKVKPSKPTHVSPAGRTVTVRPGDTLSGIATAHGLKLESVIRANPQIRNPELIHPGQRVRLPEGPTEAGRQVTVRSGDTLTSLGREHGVSVDAILLANPHVQNPDFIVAGSTLAMPASAGPTAGASSPSAPPVERRRASTDTQESARKRAAVAESKIAAKTRSAAGTPAAVPSKRTKPLREGAPQPAGPRKDSPAPALSSPEANNRPSSSAMRQPGSRPRADAAPLPVPASASASAPGTVLKPTTVTTTRHGVVGKLPYSKTSVSAAERAGYHGVDAKDAVFRQVTIRENGQLTSVKLLEHRNAANVWSDERGTEYYLSKPLTISSEDGTQVRIYDVRNKQPAGSDPRVVSTTLPTGSMIVPALGKKADERIAELEKKGFVVEGILGTGFIDAKGKSIVGYHYVNEARLRGREAPADAGGRADGLGSGKIHAGYRITRDGQMKLLDFGGMPRERIRAELKKLESDPDTAAINLFAHTAASRPEDLVGVIGAKATKTALGKARSAMVFDAKGDFVGHVRTPPVSLLDSVTLAKQVYGERASRVLNQDGDFYAQTWFADDREGSSEIALKYDNPMVLVRKRSPGDPASVLTPKHPLQQAADNAQYWFAENVVDNAKDALGRVQIVAGQVAEPLVDGVRRSLGRHRQN